MCTQLGLQGEMLELCVPLDSVRAADSECANVEKCFEMKLERKKGTLFKYLYNCWELIVFSCLNNGGGDNCVYIFMFPPHTQMQ